MNTLFIGIVAILAVVTAAMAGTPVSTFFQWHSTILVLGGTVAIFFLSTPARVIHSVRDGFARFFKREARLGEYSSELQQLARDRASGADSKHPLIQYASELWSQGVDSELVVALLSQRRQELEAQRVDAAQSLKNLSKYPPALGMTGTVMGMVSLFSVLDTAKGNIGIHLSTAMTATFLGLALANGVVSPLADRLQVVQMADVKVLDSVYEVLLLINRGEAAILINQELASRAA